MERNDFDKMLRDRLEGVTVPAPDVWEGISRGLARKHRQVLLRRFATATVAAAAGLAVALLVFRGPQPGREVAAPVRTARAVAPVLPQEMQESRTAPVSDIAPIAEQAAAFTRQRLVAQAAPATSASEVSEADPLSRTATDGEPATEPAVEPAQEPATVDPVAEPVIADPVVSVPEASAQDGLTGGVPADFWPDDGSADRTHTFNLSILSNLTAVASDGDLMYKAGPMHSSSQTGSRAVSPVEPVAGTPKFYMPLSFGVQVGVPLDSRFSVAAGVTYTYLVSRYDMLVDKVRYDAAYNQLHYVGIPLSLSCNFAETPSLRFYATAGGAAEKCVAQRYIYASNTMREKVSGLQWSARVGLGVLYAFNPHVGLYFDPSLVYYFDNSQPLSIRTQQPLQTRIELGLRFSL